MRRCLYHTDLRQNAVFHSFSGQIALIQYLKHRSTHGLLAKPFKKISKMTYTASWFSLLTKLAPILLCTLKKTSLCLFSIKWFYNDV